MLNSVNRAISGGACFVVKGPVVQEKGLVGQFPSTLNAKKCPEVLACALYIIGGAMFVVICHVISQLCSRW